MAYERSNHMRECVIVFVTLRGLVTMGPSNKYRQRFYYLQEKSSNMIVSGPLSSPQPVEEVMFETLRAMKNGRTASWVWVFTTFRAGYPWNATDERRIRRVRIALIDPEKIAIETWFYNVTKSSCLGRKFIHLHRSHV